MDLLANYLGWENYKLVPVGESYYDIKLVEGVNMKAKEANKLIRKLENGKYYHFYTSSKGNLYMFSPNTDETYMRETYNFIERWEKDRDPNTIKAQSLLDKLTTGSDLNEEEKQILSIYPGLSEFILSMKNKK